MSKKHYAPVTLLTLFDKQKFKEFTRYPAYIGIKETKSLNVSDPDPV
jgi:hypothetical protein